MAPSCRDAFGLYAKKCCSSCHHARHGSNPRLMPFLIRCRQANIHTLSGFSCNYLCNKGHQQDETECRAGARDVPGEKKSGRHGAALYRSLTEKSCAQPLVPRCCSQLFCQLSLSQSKGRNELPTDYGTKARRKPT